MFIVLMVMTLMTLWLEPKSFERMVIANLNFICHLLCIHDVHWEMPRSGFNTPKIRKYSIKFNIIIKKELAIYIVNFLRS